MSSSLINYTSKVVCICNTNIEETEVERPRVQSQPRLHRKTQSQNKQNSWIYRCTHKGSKAVSTLLFVLLFFIMLCFETGSYITQDDLKFIM